MGKERGRLSLDAPKPVDVAQFAPRPARRRTAPESGAGDAIAAEHGFTAREQPLAPPEAPERPPRRNRPPPFDALMSIRAYKADVEAFHQLADEMGWKSGRLLSELLKAYKTQQKD